GGIDRVDDGTLPPGARDADRNGGCVAEMKRGLFSSRHRRIARKDGPVTPCYGARPDRAAGHWPNGSSLSVGCRKDPSHLSIECLPRVALTWNATNFLTRGAIGPMLVAGVLFLPLSISLREPPRTV